MRIPRFALIAVFGWIAATAQTGRSRQTPSPAPGISSEGEFSERFLRQQCIEFSQVKRGDKPDDIRDCRVSEFGEFGRVGEIHYYYALYCLIPNGAPDKGLCNDGSFNGSYHRNRGLAIFVSDSSGLKFRIHLERVAQEIGRLVYSPPQVILNPAGTILYVPIAIDGTAHENASEYFLWDEGKWEPIEAYGWLKDLYRQIPTGLEIRKGVWPDLRTMRAEAGLYRHDDSNASSTGGRARIRLSIRSSRFVLDSLAFEKPR